RAHQIGKDDSYPLSPTPVMSYIDLEVSGNNNTITPSRRSCRSRVKLLAEVSLSMSCNVSSPMSCPSSPIINDTNQDVCSCDPPSTQSPNVISQSTNPPSPCVTTRVTCASSRVHSSKLPPSVLTNLDPDDDIIIPYPPRPNPNHTPNHYHQPSLEPVVAPSGCTAGNSGTPLASPTPHHPTSNSPELSLPTSTHQSSSEPTVALSGCTTGDGDVVPNQSSNSPTFDPDNPPSPSTASQNPFIIPPPLPDSFLSSSTTDQSQPNNPIHQSSSEPTVALSGCTAGDGNFVPNQSSNPPTFGPDNPPSSTASQNHFIIPPPLSDSFLSSSTTYQSQPNNNQVPNANPPPNNVNDPFQDRWSSVFLDTISWDVFSNQCEKFSEDVIKTSQEKQSKKPSAGPRHPLRPSACPVNNNRASLRYNPREARKIQALYRLSKKRAARQVLNNNSPSYTGSTDDGNTFFTNVFGEKHCNTDKVKRGLDDFVPSSPIDENLYAPVTPEEAAKKLRSLSNSALGSDKVEYRPPSLG
ncbi:Hypothetical predicted protein, partial [Paramuricea clavata]